MKLEAEHIQLYPALTIIDCGFIPIIVEISRETFGDGHLDTCDDTVGVEARAIQVEPDLVSDIRIQLQWRKRPGHFGLDLISITPSVLVTLYLAILYARCVFEGHAQDLLFDRDLQVRSHLLAPVAGAIFLSRPLHIEAHIKPGRQTTIAQAQSTVIVIGIEIAIESSYAVGKVQFPWLWKMGALLM